MNSEQISPLPYLRKIQTTHV